MAQKFTVPISIKQLSSAGSDALTIFVNGEAYGRLKVEAGGRISWSDGTGVYDTNLYRIGANVLGTDDAFKASAGLITATSSGAPTSLIADGALAVDTTNDALYIRTNASWKKVQGGATVSAGAPTSPVQGDLWWDSDISELFVYYNNAWVAVADISVDTLDDLGDVVITTPKAGQMLAYDGTQWVNSVMPSGEPIGHLNRTASVISFDEETRTFSISPTGASYEVWCKGIKYTKTATETVTIPDTSGLYYIYFSNTGVLSYKTTFFDWENDTPTSYIYWNAVDNKAYFFADERHGITLDWATHEYLHRTRGAVIASGFGANNYIVDGDGSLDSHAKLDIANGTFFDEDLEVDIVHSSTPAPNSWQQKIQGGALIPVFYHSGVGQWIKDVATVFPLKQGTARAQFNSYDIGSLTWSTTDIAPNKFGISWIIATNNLNEPIIAVLGQDSYNTIGEAEASVWEDLNLDGFPIFEFRPLHKVIYETSQTYANTPKARFVGIYDLRRATSSGDSIASTPVSDHGSMTGLLDDDHPQYLTDSRHNALDHSTAMGSVVLDDISDVAISTPQNGDFLRYNGSSWVNDPVNLTTDTVGDYVQNLVAGTGVSITNNSGEGSTPTVAIGQSVEITATPTFAGATLDAIQIGVSAPSEIDTTSGNLTIDSAGGTVTIDDNLIVSGNFIVSGTTTSVNTETLTIDDNIIVLNNNETGTPSQNAGIEIERGTSANVLLRWNETADKWEITNDGTEYNPISTTTGTETLTNKTLTSPTINNPTITGVSPTITLGGDLSGSLTLTDLSSGTLNATIGANSVALGTDTTGNYVATVATSGTGISVSGSGTENASVTITSNATDANTPSAIVARDGSGNFAAGTITANLSGNASTATSLQTSRTIELTGDVTGSASFDGTANATISATIAANSVALGADTTGNFVADVVAGTAISVTHTPGEASSASIALNASLNDLNDVVVSAPAEFQALAYDGSGWVPTYTPVVSYVRNAEATTLASGTVVYLFGGNGDHASVKRADNALETTSSKTVGVMGTAVASNQNGPVITRGYVDGIDLSAYSVGDILWLGNNGGVTTTKPSAPLNTVFIGVVVRATANGIIYVAVQNGYELNELHDVKTNGKVDKDVLMWNSASAVWVNEQINLGTDTVGDYVQNLVAGTGISLANNSGEGATPTINLSASIDDLSDVTITSVSTGQVLKWNGSAWVNSADNTGTTINSLDDIGDVVITSVSTGQVLKWNGTAWVNSSDDTGTTINALDDIGNVTAPTPSSGDFLKWNGTAWVNDVIDLGTDTTGNYLSGVSAGTGISVTHTPGEGSTATVGLNATLDNLSDVTISSVTIGQVLKWNGTAWVNDTDSGGSTGSTITASDTAPSSPSDGDMWWNTAELELFVYASSAWVQVTENANQVTDLADLFDVSGTFPTNGQFLSYDNVDGEWKPTDISSGTGISIARTGGITPETTISLDASLDDLSDVSVAGVSANEYLKWSGSSWVADYPNARVTTGVTPPLTPSEGDLWLKTDELLIFVYYSSSWVQVSSDTSSTVEELTDLVDVEIGDFPNFRDVLMWDGANWSNSYPNARIYANVTSPSFPVEGDMWLKTDELIAFVYYSGTWVQLTGTEESVEELGDLIDVSVVEPMEGQVLTWDSGEWVNKDIATSFSPPSLTYIRSAGIASTETLIENRLTFTPITVGGCRISTIGAASAIGNAGAIVRLGIYRSDESGFPGELLYDAGTIEPVGNSTFYPIAIPPWVNLYLTAGRYWLAAVAQDGSPNMYVVDNLETASSLGFQRTFISSPSGSNPFDLMSINPGVIYQDGVSGALPLTATPKYDNSQLTACSVAVQIF